MSPTTHIPTRPKGRFAARRRAATVLLVTTALASAAVIAPATLAPTVGAAAAPSDVVIGGFETGTAPWFVVTGGDATVTASTTTDAPASGAAAARLALTTANGLVEFGRSITPVEAREVSFSIRAPQLTGIVVRLIDGTGQAHQQTVALDRSTGWQRVTVTDFDPTGAPQYYHWGGANDGVWHQPLTKLSLIVDSFRIQNGPSATVDIDDVIVSGPAPELAIDPVVVGNAFTTGQDVAVGFETAATTVEWSVRDTDGDLIAQDASPAAELDGEIDLGPLPTGWYSVDLVAVQPDGRRVTGGTDLSVLPASDAREERIGAATHYGQAWSTDTIPLLGNAGLGFARDEAYWQSVEQVKGSIVFTPKINAFADALEANDVDFFDIFAYGNRLYHEGEAPATDAGRQGFAAYADASVSRFGTDDTFYEVWNEWNLRDRTGPAGATAENYAALLATTTDRVRAAHPDAVIVGPALAPMDDWSGWVDDFIAAGGLDDLDAFTTHPYNFTAQPEAFMNHVAIIRAKLDAAGHPDMPIWLSEHGWHTSTTPTGVDEPTQASNLARAQLLALGEGLGKYTTYDFKDDGTEPEDAEHRFGIIRNENDPRGAYTPKPAYAAQGILTRQTDERPVEGMLALGDGRYGVEFGPRGDEDSAVRMQALWALQPQTWSVEAAGTVTVTDLYGTETQLQPDADGRVHVAVDQEPIYLSGELGEVVTSSPYSLAVTEAVEGTAPAAEFTVAAADRALDVILRSEAGDTTAAAAVGQSTTVDALLPSAPVGAHVWHAEVVEGGVTVGLVRVRAEVGERLALAGVHALDAAGADQLRLTLQNRGAEAVQIDAVDWTIGAATGQAFTDFSLAGHDTATVDIPVTEFGAWTAAASGDASAYATGTLVDTEPVGVPHRAVTVDGVLDTAVSLLTPQTLGQAEQSITGWAGDSDHSGRLWLTHDDDRLYVTAVITDDVHAQPARGADIWQGDGLQLGTTPGWPGEHVDPTSEVGTALTSTGVVDVARWLPVGASTADVVSAVTRDEANKQTTYELSVPFSTLGVSSADGLLAATVAINENDGNGRRGWSSWGAGVAESKDPTKFRPLRLLAPSADEVRLATTATSFCLARAPRLLVTATNLDQVPVSVKVTTPIGSFDAGPLDTRRSVVKLLTGSGNQLAKDKALVQAWYVDANGALVFDEQTVSYRAVTCRG